MLKIGLTGGIGCGKSAVAQRFSKLGVPVIDADQSARAVVEPGTPGLQQIIERFGAEVLTASGSLDRQALRTIVFEDPQARQDLESILHPLIRQHMWGQLESLDHPYAILDIPLLFETGQNKLMDRVLVVDCTKAIQISRICQRDGASVEEATAIIDSQVNRQVRLEGADDIIDNNGSLESLQTQVRDLHQKYLRLSG